MQTLAGVLYLEPARPLSEGDAAHDAALTIYRAWLIEKARESGSVQNLAARCKISASVIHTALDRSRVEKLRQVCHEVRRKLPR